MDTETKALWDQQPEESAKAYAAFIIFRDLGAKRTLPLVADAIYPKRRENGTSTARKPTPGQVNKWAGQFNWRVRALAWDRHLVSEAEEKQRQQRIEAVSRHTQNVQELQAVALRRLTGDTKNRLGAMELQAATKALIDGQTAERLALGLPTQITRTESELRAWMTEFVNAHETLFTALDQHLCDACRTRVISVLEEVERQITAARTAAL